MQKITPDSLRELNTQLDAVQILRTIGCKRVEPRGAEQVLADCPLEPGGKGSLTVEVGPNFATCSSRTCAAAQRRSLLWVYCKATGTGLQEGAQALADQVGVLLEFEGEEASAPPPIRPIEIVQAPAEIGPLESAALVGERRHEEREGGKKLLCPILKQDCVEGDCRWWVVDWIEDKNLYRRNCAVSLIAIGLTEPAAKKK